jgi:benzoyl-CoA reductase/2-hydroxyglutaryl-CoA dehydratase subunit BcrC/BadD/HgdB
LSNEGVIEQTAAGLMELVAAGEELIGYIYPHTPLELIMAHGLTPSLVRALPQVPSGYETSLQTFACSYIRNLYSQRVSDQLPPLAGLLFPGNTCDSLQNLGDVWRFRFPMDRVFRLTYPVSRHIGDESAQKYLAEELRLLSCALETTFKRPFMNDSYNQALSLVSEFRQGAKILYSARVANPKILSYSNVVNLVRKFLTTPTPSAVAAITEVSSKIQTTAEELGILKNIESIRNAFETGDFSKVTLPANLERPRLVIAGGMVEPQAMATLFSDIPDVSESVIVMDLFSFGFKSVFAPALREAEDPFMEMARSLLAAPGEPTQEGLEHRMTFLKKLLKHLSIDGLLICEQSFCDPDQFEAPSIERAASDMAVKTSRIPIDPELSDRSRIEVRIQSFIETLTAS